MGLKARNFGFVFLENMGLKVRDCGFDGLLTMISETGFEGLGTVSVKVKD